MSENPEEIINNIIDGSDTLNNYLDRQMKDVLMTIIKTMFDVHSYSDNPIKVFLLINIIIDKYTSNLLTLYQNTMIKTLKNKGLIGDLTRISEEKNRMK